MASKNAAQRQTEAERMHAHLVAALRECREQLARVEQMVDQRMAR